MPVFDEDDKELLNLEESPKRSPEQTRESAMTNRSTGVTHKFSAFGMVLIALILLEAIATFSLWTRISTMRDELRRISPQLLEIQSNVGTRVEATHKERDKLKSEIARLQTDIVAIKGQLRHLSEETSSLKQAGEPKKKAPPALAPKKIQKEKRPEPGRTLHYGG